LGYVRSSHPVSSFRVSLPGAGHEIRPTVVWLQGEQDIATDGELWQVLACGIAANDAAIVVDLSEVELMSASTLGVMVKARVLLREQSRSLTVRYPSAFVRRIIGICGLDDLLGPSGQQNDGGAGDALGSWVAVPSSETEHPPERVGAAIDLREHAVIVERAMSTTSKGVTHGEP
jgi:anti-anti-sigma factor